MKTEIHRSASRQPYLDRDVDAAGNDDVAAVVRDIRGILGKTPLAVVRTRGGAHVLVKRRQLDPAVKASFYGELQALGQRLDGLLEIRGDAMVPVPGSSQGGAVPRLLRE